MTSWFLAVAFGAALQKPVCKPTHPSPRRWEKTGPSRSMGRPANGTLKNATRIPEDGEFLKVLPARHRARRLNYSSDALAQALERAAREVAQRHPGAILWIGNTAGPYGGALAPYSVSHQTGLDADVAFYSYAPSGAIARPEDLIALDATGKSFDGEFTFATDIMWSLVTALLTDPKIEVKYLLIYDPFRDKLLEYAKANKAPKDLIQKASKALLQPSDAGPHNDHLHIRIKCPPGIGGDGCVD
jgi:murein endopeptidase